MEIALVIGAVLSVIFLLVLFGLIVKFLFDAFTKMTEKHEDGKPTVYMLRVSPDGEVKIRKYRGSVNYLSDKNWSDAE